MNGRSPWFLLTFLFALAYSIVLFNVVSEFKQLPSPIFGGDYYYQLGCINHMYYSSPLEWFSSCNGIGSSPGYLPAYGILVTIFGKILGLSPMKAMIYFSILVPFLSLFAFFFFYKRLFRSEPLAFLGAVISVNFFYFPVLKYTDFTNLVFVPLFFLALFLFFEHPNLKNAVVLGVMYGIMGLAHSTSFMFATISVALLVAYLLFLNWREKKEINFQLLKAGGVAFLIGFALSLLVWFNGIFVYHGSPPMKTQLWTTPDFRNPEVAWRFFFRSLGKLFFNTSSIFKFVASVGSLLALYFLIKERKSWGKVEEYIFFLFTVSFIYVFSYFITSPFFDTHLVPNYGFGMYLIKMQPILLLWLIHKKLNEEKYHLLFIFLILLLFLLDVFAGYDNWYHGKWMEVGRTPLNERFIALQNFLVENTSVNDVVLTNNELSFMVNALTGRKVVISRRSQNDPFTPDFDRRELDAAIIFYGNSDEKRKELLKKYNVKYIYYDASWVRLEFTYNNYFDPILVLYSPEREKELQQYGIKYIKIHSWVDPAIRRPDVRTYDLLIISPENYDTTGYGPWKDDLDKYLKKVWSYEKNGITYSALYEVDIHD